MSYATARCAEGGWGDTVGPAADGTQKQPPGPPVVATRAHNTACKGKRERSLADSSIRRSLSHMRARTDGPKGTTAATGPKSTAACHFTMSPM